MLCVFRCCQIMSALNFNSRPPILLRSKFPAMKIMTSYNAYNKCGLQSMINASWKRVKRFKCANQCLHRHIIYTLCHLFIITFVICEGISFSALLKILFLLKFIVAILFSMRRVFPI
jgi:hypothetical protein